MTITIYEVNAPNFHAQVKADPKHGWCVSINDASFQPMNVEYYNEHQLDLLRSLFVHTNNAALYQHLLQQLALAKQRVLARHQASVFSP